jgi:hypothetical protein
MALDGTFSLEGSNQVPLDGAEQRAIGVPDVVRACRWTTP